MISRPVTIATISLVWRHLYYFLIPLVRVKCVWSAVLIPLVRVWSVVFLIGVLVRLR